MWYSQACPGCVAGQTHWRRVGDFCHWGRWWSWRRWVPLEKETNLSDYQKNIQTHGRFFFWWLNSQAFKNIYIFFSTSHLSFYSNRRHSQYETEAVRLVKNDSVQLKMFMKNTAQCRNFGTHQKLNGNDCKEISHTHTTTQILHSGNGGYVWSVF